MTPDTEAFPEQGLPPDFWQHTLTLAAPPSQPVPSGLREAAAAFVRHMDGPEPRRGLWTTLKADREAIRAALTATATPPADEALREAARRAEFALSLALGATYDDRTWLDEAQAAASALRAALGESR